MYRIFKSNILTFLLGVLCFNGAAQDAYIPRALNLQQKSYAFRLDTSYFSAMSKVDSLEVKKNFENGESFSQMTGELSGSFGWTREVQIMAGVRYHSNTSHVFDGTTTQALNNAGFDSFFVQANYMFPRKSKFISNIEFRYRQTTYTNPDFDTTRPYSHLNLGDGAREITAGYRMYYGFQKLGSGVEASLLYNAPANLSSELIYDFKLITGANLWSFWGGVTGSLSLSGDEYTDNPSSKPKAYTGSSALYNSINRSKMSAYGGLAYRITNSWRAEFSYQHDLSGKSTDLGGRFLLGLTYRVDSKYIENTQKLKFKDYDLEAIVEKSSSQGNYVIINKGFTQGVQVKTFFDFFAFDFKGGNKLLARGAVVKTKSRESVVRITKWYGTQRNLAEGVIGRASLAD